MKITLRTKLLASFLVVVLISGLATSWVGVRLIGDEIIRRTEDNVRGDLRTARETYEDELDDIKDVILLTSVQCNIREFLLAENTESLRWELSPIRERESLDFLTITDASGTVVLRARSPENYGDSQAQDEIVSTVLNQREIVASTQILPREELLKEAPELAEQARVKVVPTPKSRRRGHFEITDGMVIKVAAPMFDDFGELVGVLYGGKLLNQSSRIVDKVKDIVFRGEKFEGKDVGTVTVFQGDLRVSTNVMQPDGTRAVGTAVSEEVYNLVIDEGIPWIGRAFVVDEWYISAYEPIKNVHGEIIGMLYVGTLEAPYVDVRRRVVFTFLLIALITFVLLFIMVYFTTTNIVKPVRELLFATGKVAAGDLAHRVKTESTDEIGQLTASFNKMTEELQRATERNLLLTRTLEDKIRDKTEELEEAQDQLVRSEKLTSLGKMAAGIAHEINNPLTSILINSHLIEEKLKENDESRENLELIIDETSRCATIVRGLLQFSRQTPPQKELADMGEVIERTLFLLRSQTLVHNVQVNKDFQPDLPQLMIDVNKIGQLFTNIILNALDAIDTGGQLTIQTRLSSDNRFVEIRFTDTGCGIPSENIRVIFDPFFTTKGTKGTGLGLSVSYGIVEQHNGSISVESEVGKGSTFTVRLPLHEREGS
jgi:two-component system NtrC family sensor kinase